MGTAVGGFGFSGTTTGGGVALLVHPARANPAHTRNTQPTIRIKSGESLCKRGTSKKLRLNYWQY
jgi:hypothetical protein